MKSLQSRLCRQPIAHEPAVAAEIAARFGDDALAVFLGAVAGSSPYLRDLIRKEEAWLREAVEDPEGSVRLELEASPSLQDLPVALRRSKRRVALMTALCDLGGVWTLEQVTGALTQLADRAVDLSIRLLVEDEVRRGKLADGRDAGGMFALAMGKMGAGELNYSSDIDLICLFDESRYGEDWQDARSAFIRVTRKMAAILSDITAEGYVFRTDLRLRPDASVTPVCISMSAAEAYYESVGRTWERAAYIKARPCGGDIAAGERFLAALRPFVWRKHLDFAAIQDAHDMRHRIRDHRGLHGALIVEGHNMKLGRGGIREIEFFTQTRQLIAGGRDPDLRDRTTVGGLNALAAKGWIPQPIASELIELYRTHREVEHRLQMVSDQQTHEIPNDANAISRIAHLCGEDDAHFRSTLLDRLQRTEELTESFFAPSDAEPEPEIGEKARQIVEGWRNYPALRSDRAQMIFRRLRPQLLRRLQSAANADEALLALDGFLRGLPAGVQIFSLFDSNPQLVDLIIDVASVSPELSRYLSTNSDVLDAVIGGSFFDPWPPVQELSEALAARMGAEADYERKLDSARRWMKEWHFRIGVHHLRGISDSFQAGKEYADLAEAVLRAIWPVVVGEFALRHGPQPGRGAVVMGMGSLGAGRLHSRSDLDLIVIYDAEGIEESSGVKPLATRQYFSRLTQALVTALSARMSQGQLYEVDMRLRPSGRQGPVATAMPSFRAYQMDEAWTWEHLALTRARPLAGGASLMADVEALRREILTIRGTDPRIRSDVGDMRRRLADAKPPKGALDMRNGAGRMMDVELLAEMLALESADPARQVERQLAHLKVPEVLSAYRLFWRIHCASRLLSGDILDEATLAEGAARFLQREAGTALSGVATRAEDVARVIQTVLSAAPQPRGQAR